MTKLCKPAVLCMLCRRARCRATGVARKHHCFACLVQHGAWLVAAAAQPLTLLPFYVQVLAGMQPDLSALAGLSRLQCCYLSLNAGAAGAPEAALPPGPWLASLRWLRAGVDTLASNTAVLQGATALERLEVGEPYAMRFNWRPPAVTSFFKWLAQHPPLQRVSFGGENPGYGSEAASVFDSTAFARRLQLLAHRRPALQLVRMPDARDPNALLGTLLAR